MQKIDEYSDSDHPNIKTSVYPCDTSSVMPYDVSKAASACTSVFEEFISVFQEQKSNFSSGVEALANDWGSSFVSINGHSFHIVRTERFNEYYEKLIKAIEDAKDKCVNVCNEVTSETEDVKKVLTNMQNRYNELQKWKSDLASEENKPKDQQDSNLITELKSNIDSTEPLVISTDDIWGSWIVE